MVQEFNVHVHDAKQWPPTAVLLELFHHRPGAVQGGEGGMNGHSSAPSERRTETLSFSSCLSTTTILDALFRRDLLAGDEALDAHVLQWGGSVGQANQEGQPGAWGARWVGGTQHSTASGPGAKEGGGCGGGQGCSGVRGHARRLCGDDREEEEEEEE